MGIPNFVKAYYTSYYTTVVQGLDILCNLIVL